MRAYRPVGGARPLTAVRASSLQLLLSWSPALIAALYLVVFVSEFPALVRRVYWNSDAATITVTAQTLGRGSVAVFAHCSWLTALWFLLLTRSLPLHRELWDVAPYALSLAAVVLLAACAGRLAGRWAAVMTAALGLAASPVVNYSRLALDFHGDACVAAVVLAAFALWLVSGPGTVRALAVAVPVAALAGATLASDALFAVVGLLPFALSGLVMLVVLRLRRPGLIAIACSIGSLALYEASNWLSSRAGIEVLVSPRAPLRLAPIADLGANLGRLVGLVAQVGDGGYSQAGWAQPTLSARSLLSLACAALILLALAAPFLLVGRQLRAAAVSPSLAVWGCFWSLAVAGNCAAYVFSGEGTQWGYYLIPVAYAVAATVPTLLAGSSAHRLFAALGIAALTGASLVSLVGRLDAFGAAPPIASVASRVAAIAKAEDAPYGYTTDYWDAAALSWSSGLRVQVAPLWYCAGTTRLCPFLFNVVSTWYQPHDSRSFVIQPTIARPGETAYDGLGTVDPASIWIDTGASSPLGRPIRVFRLDGQLSMYVYPYDLAARLDDHTNSAWSPALSYGPGFDAPERFDGAPSRWLIQDGGIDIDLGVASRLTIAAEAFSNQRERTLELVASGGRVLGRRRVATFAQPLTFGPIVLPPGRSRLELVADPGPQRLGLTDPREASVFLESMTISAQPAIVGAAVRSHTTASTPRET